MERKYRVSRMAYNTSRFTFHALCYLLLSVSVPMFAQDQVTLTLENASRLVLKNSEKVLKAQKILDRATANLRIARSAYFPQLGLTGLYERRKKRRFRLGKGITSLAFPLVNSSRSLVRSQKIWIRHKKMYASPRLNSSVQSKRSSLPSEDSGTTSP